MKINKHFFPGLFFWTSGWKGLVLRASGWIVLLFVASCGSGRGDAGKKVFYYNESDGVATLDPAFAKNRSIMWVVHQLYSTLVETDDQLRFVPALARSWEVSTDR